MKTRVLVFQLKQKVMQFLKTQRDPRIGKRMVAAKDEKPGTFSLEM